MPALPRRVYIIFFCFSPLAFTQRHTVQRLTTENITNDGDHCNDCIELARKARRKSQALNKDSNLPPDSAKIRKLLELLKEINARKDDEGEPAGEKTIVFSQFTSMLDLIQPFLKDAGIAFVRCKLLLLLRF
jgi:SNF2 family DNA or RNA helicase